MGDNSSPIELLRNDLFSVRNNSFLNKLVSDEGALIRDTDPQIMLFKGELSPISSSSNYLFRNDLPPISNISSNIYLFRDEGSSITNYPSPNVVLRDEFSSIKDN